MPWEERSRTLQKWFQSDTSITDPPLLKEYSTCRSFTIGGPKPITYSSVRTFYRPHPQADKLPSEPTALPLLVFIHGLGGSLSQFATLMTSLTKVAPCLGIDLPGCGLSKFAPRAWEAYTTEALVRLVATVIQEHREASKKQGIVLLGHSMGCSMGALLASSKSEFSDATSKYALGLIAICPQASPPDEKKTRRFKQLLGIPGPIFELWRLWDKRGGTESASVARHVGPGADIETKKMQVKFNAQSRTPVFRRVAQGSLPDYSSDTAVGGLPGADVWAGLEVPVLLIGGEADKVTPAEEL
ncbi:MAG: hypothetical protein M1820_007540 [Bogoriella megaspora]|nr:MAG: hypothetical protein M1820_007540 [Bogoriella megaspora]